MTLDNAGMDERIIGVCPPIGSEKDIVSPTYPSASVNEY